MSQQQGNISSRAILANVGKNLLHQWATFVGVFFSPFVLILVVATAALLYVSLSIPDLQSQPVVSAIITVFISIFSGLVGALVSRRWSEITEGGILITRGKSAIRGLKLLLLNVAAVEQRIKTYASALDESEAGYRVTSNSYDELVERCKSLQEEAINAIEEWQDIIPEAANLKTQIGVLSDLKVQQLTLEQQVADTRSDLIETKTQSQGEKDRLNGQLREKEHELSRVKSELRRKESELGSTITSSALGTILQNKGLTSFSTPGLIGSDLPIKSEPIGLIGSHLIEPEPIGGSAKIIQGSRLGQSNDRERSTQNSSERLCSHCGTPLSSDVGEKPKCPRCGGNP